MSMTPKEFRDLDIRDATFLLNAYSQSVRNKNRANRKR